MENEQGQAVWDFVAICQQLVFLSPHNGIIACLLLILERGYSLAMINFSLGLHDTLN